MQEEKPFVDYLVYMRSPFLGWRFKRHRDGTSVQHKSHPRNSICLFVPDPQKMLIKLCPFNDQISIQQSNLSVSIGNF